MVGVAPDHRVHSSVVEVGFTIVVAALVLYIVVSQPVERWRRRHCRRRLSESFDNLNNSVYFMMSNPDSSVSTYSAGDFGMQITNLIQGTAKSTYERALKTSGGTINALNGRIDTLNNTIQGLIDQVNDLTQAAIRKDTNTYQIKSMQFPGDNCLDSYSNGRNCNWDNGYDRFVVQETPYALDSTVNQNSKSSTTYVDKGCWVDASDRALSYVANDQPYTVETCGALASKMKSQIFALQAGGDCWIAQGTDDYAKHGRSNGPCDPLGGGWINHVYMASD